MSHWNHRVHEFTDGTETWWAIHETYYDDNGQPNGWCAEPADVHSAADDEATRKAELIDQLDRMRRCIDAPVLILPDRAAIAKGGRAKIEGPVHDLDDIKNAIREGRVQFMGDPPDMRPGAVHDFTVTRVDIPGNDAFALNWQTVSAGFGQLVFYRDEEGRTRCQNETMSREFVRSVLMKLADDVILDDDKKDSH